jgi:hypothetical protein
MLVYGELGGSNLGHIPGGKKNNQEIAVRISGVPTKNNSNRNLSEQKSGAFWSEKN